MPSVWVEHVKDFAKRKNLSYGCALSDPKCSEEYRIKFPKPAKKVKEVKVKKGKKLDLSKTEFVPLEEEIPDTEPKTKMVIEKKPPAPPAPPAPGPPKEQKAKKSRALTAYKKSQLELAKVNLTEKWKVGEEILDRMGKLYIIRKVNPSSLTLQEDLPVIESSVKAGDKTEIRGKYPREFNGPKLSMKNTSHSITDLKLVPANYKYAYKSVSYNI